MSFTSEDLIKAVMRRPALWNPSDPGYSDKDTVNMMWKQIKRLNKYDSVVRIRKKWKNLKDQYRKELKKCQLARPGQPLNKYRSTWKHFETMSFVRELVSRNLGELSAEPQELYTDDSAEEQEKPLRETPQTRARASSPAPSESSSTVSRKISSYDMRLEFLNIQKKKLRMQEKQLREKLKRQKQREREKSDDDYLFLMTVLPHMRQFSPAQKLRIRNKIYSVVLDELEGQEHLIEAYPYDNKME